MGAQSAGPGARSQHFIQSRPRIHVASYKDPSFNDRTAAAKAAKQKALDLLKAKPPVDEAVLAERRRIQAEKDEALAKERAAKAEALAAAKAEKAAIKAAKLAAEAEEKAAAEAAAALKAARLKPATAAEMKAARDARYAARKARTGR